MSLDEYYAVLRNASKLGIGIISFTGGEPLLWPHLDQAITSASEAGMLVGLTTNGVLLTEDRVRSLAAAKLDQLIVSIDSVRKTTYSDKSLESHPHLLHTMGLAAYEYGIQVSANAVLGPANCHAIGDLIQTLTHRGFALSIGFLDAPISPTTDQVLETEPFKMPQDAELLRKTVSEILDMKRNGYLIIEPPEYFLNYRRHLEGEVTWNCANSKKHSVQIAPSGNLFLCTRRNELPIPFKTLDREHLTEIQGMIMQRTRECNPKCYCNCSFNNYFYRDHTIRFLTRVAIPTLHARRRGRRMWRKRIQVQEEPQHA